MKNWMLGLVALTASRLRHGADAVAENRSPGGRRATGGGRFRQRLHHRRAAVAAELTELPGDAYDQRRYFGHPDLLAFIQRLSSQANQKALGTVLIGDMAMPAGGRFSSGHASHQSGLDVDIWLQLPRQRWSAQQLLKPQPIDLVSGTANRWWPANGSRKLSR